jgi:Glycosyl transferase family 11
MAVCLKLVGGLGNQIWIRSFGYALEALGNEVVFDRWYFDNVASRAYALDRFNTEVVFGSPRGREIGEGGLRYHSDLLKKYDEDVTISGYFQCPRYLEGVEDMVRKAFTLRRYPSDRSLAVANKIHNCNSVSLHVRRTDTLSPRGLAHHGLIPHDYYVRAIRHILGRVPSPHFFVFSDDMAWCEGDGLFEGLPVTFVDHNTTGVEVLTNYEVRKTDNGTEHEDLWLMSQCKHSIGANSSFGFWGSWLMQNPQKICIVPQQWFTPQSEHTAIDMIPESWVKL